MPTPIYLLSIVILWYKKLTSLPKLCDRYFYSFDILLIKGVLIELSKLFKFVCLQRKLRNEYYLLKH